MTLKKCSACGNDPQIVKEEEFLTDDVIWAIGCDHWHCPDGPRVTAGTREEAESLWNSDEKGQATDD